MAPVPHPSGATTDLAAVLQDNGNPKSLPMSAKERHHGQSQAQ
jgi:hypothetical protein